MNTTSLRLSGLWSPAVLILTFLVAGLASIASGQVITEFHLAAGSQPESIAAGPDGNLWFTERNVVDHIIPLVCGGKDDPSNMQWQTAEEAKVKDKWERRGCH